jgi:quercetin dioxygenase-like cupin family protein
MTQYRIDFRSMPWTSGTSGVRQKVFRANNGQLRLVEYSKAMHQHWCEKGHTEYVLNGKMEIEFENEAQTYSAGDGVYLPSGSEHKHVAKVLTDTVTVVFVEDL